MLCWGVYSGWTCHSNRVWNMHAQLQGQIGTDADCHSSRGQFEPLLIRQIQVLRSKGVRKDKEWKHLEQSTFGMHQKSTWTLQTIPSLRKLVPKLRSLLQIESWSRQDNQLRTFTEGRQVRADSTPKQWVQARPKLKSNHQQWKPSEAFGSNPRGYQKVTR